MYDEFLFGIPRHVYSKLPCKKCKLRTEHVKVSLPSGVIRYICLRCRTARTEIEVAHAFTLDELLDLRSDDSIPVGVV
jgi:hypothetical protein